MKKMYSVLLVLIVLFSGCSIFKPHEVAMTEPALLKQAPLPAIPQSFTNKEPEIICELLIGKNGAVKRADLVNSSGDTGWDYLAQQSFMKWEFSPALLDGEPIEVLIRRKIKVAYVEPEVMVLAEICCKDLKEAEVVYSALRGGTGFNELVKKYSISPSKDNDGMVGKIDIRYYAKPIRNELTSLSEEEYTKPVAYGEHYVIFKRLKDKKNGLEY
jgi:hypothetical protein